MKQRGLLVVSVMMLASFLVLGGCEEPKRSKRSASAGTEIVKNSETDITIEANSIATYSFLSSSGGDYVLYITGAAEGFRYKCDFDGEGITGERIGENFCVFKNLSTGTGYSFTLESYAAEDANVSLLLAAGDVTDGTLHDPVTLELNVSLDTQVGAYKNSGYFTFTTGDASNDTRVYVQKNSMPLEIELFTQPDFTGSVQAWSIPSAITATITSVADLDTNRTYYMTVENGGSIYADLTLKVDHYPAQDAPITPSGLSVGRWYENLLLSDRRNRYDFNATEETHTITLLSDALLWTLYAPIDGTYQTYFRCWSSTARSTKCHVSDLQLGTTYRLYVGCFFAPQCTPEHSILIE